MQAVLQNTSRYLSGGRSGLFVVIGLLVMMFIVGAVLSDRFATSNNLLNVYEQSAGLAFVSLGQTLTILTGGIDLSVGSIISLVAMLTSGLINGNPAMVLPVVLFVLVLGTLIGVM